MIHWTPPDEMKQFFPEKGLTGTEHDAVRVLYERCKEDEELKEVMTAIM